MATYNIIGYVRSLLADRSVTDLTINLYKPGGGTLLATTTTKPYGQFQFVLDDVFFETNFSVGEEAELVFEVINDTGDVLLDTAQSVIWTQAVEKDITLYIDTDELPSALLYSVSGNILHNNDVPAEGLVVKAYQQLFTETILLGTSTVTDTGIYTISYSRNLFNGVDLNRVAIIVEVYDHAGSVLLATSDTHEFQEQLTINITLDVNEDTPFVFDNISNRINARIGATALEDISDDEIKQLSISTGISTQNVTRIVRTHQLSNDIGATTDDERKYMYALFDKYTLTDNSFFEVNVADVAGIINDSIEQKIIDVNTPDVTSFTDKIKSAQVMALKAIPVNNESFTWNEVLLSIFGTDENVTTFLQGYNDVRYDSEGAIDFWSTADANTKKGFKLIALSGIQPQMISEMLAEVAADDGIHALAEKDAADWLAFIENVCTTTGELCIPTVIKNEYNLEDPGDVALAKERYANALNDAFQETYPLVTVRKVLSGTGGETVIADTDARAQVVTFLQNNLDFDLRSTKVDDIDAEVHDLTGITNVDSLKEELLPFQRVFNVTAGKPEAVLAFISDGLSSANAIASLNGDDFVASYTDTIGSAELAEEYYQKAANISLITEHAAMGIIDILGPGIDMPVIPIAATQSLQGDIANNNPDLVTLFGNMNYCPCQHCISLYSPAAYLTDLLRFLKTNASTIYTEIANRRPDIRYIDLSCKNTNTEVPYIDLVNEVLENYILKTNNIVMYPTAYQTMGNAAELKAYPEHVFFFETDPVTGERKYKDSTAYYYVYDTALSAARYPEGLPFSLALEETRTYSKNLGISRLELMNLFKSVAGSNDIDGFTTAAEYFGISNNAAKIITSQSPYDTNIWNFYGFKVESSVSPDNGIIDPSNVTGTPIYGEWKNRLCSRLDIFVQQTRLSYGKLLEMLETDFLNKEKNITISLNDDVATAPYDVTEDTCDLRYLKLNFTSPATPLKFLEKLYRFTRLWKSTNLSIYELDTILSRGLAIVDLDADDFELLGRVLMLADKINMKPNELTMFWGNIDTHRYINYKSSDLTPLKSVYDSIYANKAVINAPIDQFADPENLPSAYTDQISLIAAFSRIKESEVLSILSYLGVNTGSAVTLPILSRVYFFSAFSKTMGVSIDVLLEIFKVYTSETGTDIAAYNGLTGNNDELLYLESIIENISLIKSCGFSFEELQFLLQDKGTREKFGINNKTIQAFYEGLRRGIQKFTLADNGEYTEDTLALVKNSILQYFEKHFGLSLAATSLILDNVEIDKVSSGTVNIIEALSDPLFVQGNYTIQEEGQDPVVLSDALSWENILVLEDNRATINTPPLPDFNLTEIYYQYYRVSKAAFAIKRLALSETVLEYLLANPAVIGFDMLGMPFDGELTASTTSLYNGLLLTTQWLKTQKSLNLSDDDFIDFLSVSVATPGGSITANDLKQQWLDILSGNEKIEKVLTGLVGDSSVLAPALDTNILAVTFNADVLPSSLNTIKLLSNIRLIANWAHYTDLSVQKMYNVLVPGLKLEDAHYILLAAKAKYNNDTWLKVAKPLRDELRKKQRDAMVQYAIGNPVLEPASTDVKRIWRNENELYAYFLIDVEMDPCMMTSRIRQALNSVQLMVDRVLLGIEYKDYDASDVNNRLELKGMALKQWEQWRKWYRVWEANRKVFLYPENWIEPDLRIGKSEFFEELEADLKKDDFTDELAEDAYRNYLNKLNEVARLEPVGAFREYLDGNDVSNLELNGKPRAYTLHTIARTYSNPHTYYYRKYNEGEWLPWQKIDLDIQSDHLMPYMYNGKLYLFWLTFQKKKSWVKKDAVQYSPSKLFLNNVSDTAALPEDASSSASYASQYVMEITLNWSEYKNGTWLQYKSGKDTMKIKLHPEFETYEFNENMRRITGKNGEVTAFDIIKAQMHMSGSIYKPFNHLAIDITFPDVPANNIKDWEPYDRMRYLHAFVFTDSHSDPKVLRNDGHKSNFLSPSYTTTVNNKYVAYNDAPFSKILSFHYTENKKKEDFYSYVQNNIWKNQSFLRNNLEWWVILDAIPNGAFKITSISNFMNDVYWGGNSSGHTRGFLRSYNEFNVFSVNNPLGWDFFYEDDKSTFFVSNIPIIVDEYNQSLHAGSYVAYPYYTFKTGYHPYAKDFVQKLNQSGIPGFLNLSTQMVKEEYFQWAYKPYSWMVATPHPVNDVDFEYDGTYSCYNWELFFHTPLLIAQRLSDNQKFAEARKWYHYIFDPTSTVGADGKPTDSRQRFWKFKPFYNEANSITTLTDLLKAINNSVTSAQQQVTKWENNAFDPHAIGRVRKVAYMKNVVMKYLDNLIAWGDQLFKQDTTESINEATQLYILAANILGKRPEEIPSRIKVGNRAFAEIEGSLDYFSNAKVSIEKFVGPNVPKNANAQPPSAFYFCLPNNDKLITYWDTVADRLYKIRHCMNISGEVRNLSLFGSPIDPALLVKAAAAGIDTATFLDSLNTPASYYRFTYILQKANELCADVKALGSAMLSALEKKDAETLALLRSTHEIAVLEKVKEVKELQIQEADANIEALVKSKDTIRVRQQYYLSRVFMNAEEMKAMALNQKAITLQVVAANISALGSALANIPQFNIQAWAAIGPSFGGQQLSASLQGVSNKIASTAAIANAKAAMANTKAGYIRRNEDWQFQAELAGKELEQIDKQVIALEIRKSIAEKELDNHKLQMGNATAVDEYMRSKFTNEELYSWMISQISTTYFQSYQLAYNMAKTAERCFDYELPFAPKAKAGYIQYGYWDSLKKGLQAGEKLQYDLRKLEGAYIEGNTRDREITKHVSLVLTDPTQLIALRNTGSCTFNIPEWLYDLDYPGHYHRRIKSVSITIPCVAGPYTSISCELSLTSHTSYDKNGKAVTLPSAPFTEIATSSAQNDNGMFELNFKDERYIPFEGCGAEGIWSISLMDVEELRQFDFNTISDVILHIKYTAQTDGAFSSSPTSKAGTTKTNLQDILKGTSGISLPRYFSLRHEFSRELHTGFTQLSDIVFGGDPVAGIARPFTLNIKHDHFAYFCKGKNINISEITFYIKTSTGVAKFGVYIPAIDGVPAFDSETALDPNTGCQFVSYSTGTGLVISPNSSKQIPINIFQIVATEATAINEADVDDIFMVFEYSAVTPVTP